MDSDALDRLNGRLGTPGTRRAALGALLGAAATLPAPGPLLAGKGKRKGKEKKGRGGDVVVCLSGEPLRIPRHAVRAIKLAGGSVGACPPGGGTGTDDQDYVFVGSTTEVRGPDGLAAGGGRLFVANAASNSQGVQLFGIGANGQLTLQGSLPDSFSIAVAVDLDAAGRLYVADFFGLVRVYAIHDEGGAHRVAEIRGMASPNGIAAAGRFLFVANAAQNNLRAFRIVDGDPPTYEPVATVAGLNKPGQLAYDGGRLYAADTGNHRVQVYGVDGRTGDATLSRTIPVPNPGGIAVGGGQLYVSCSRPGDNNRSRVQVFDLDADGAATPGAVLTKGDRAFRDPRGVALGRGFLFVADTGNNRVQVFRTP